MLSRFLLITLNEDVKDNTLALVFEKTDWLDSELHVQGITKVHSLLAVAVSTCLLGVSSLKVSTSPPVSYPPLHLFWSSRIAKSTSMSREQKNTTWTSGSKKPSQVPSLTLISRTNSHCSKIGYFLYFSDGSIGREAYGISESVLNRPGGIDL